MQFLKKSTRKLDVSPNRVCMDFKNSPGLFKWDLHQATNQALQLFHTRLNLDTQLSNVISIGVGYSTYIHFESAHDLQRGANRQDF
ncbi:hypothetical protein HanXRQr2_Chr08g0328621 [Helianthus annuus]|nr:hypothetical protein HanXRQr2_Chr08g0328621 [Helianthus annuus]KAJ0900783.1 hypothetical protein HanPSC8_Chr08g0317671 [Helianthus annuus]